MKLTADEMIRQLALTPHVEGGYFKELYQNAGMVDHPERKLSSTICYLLKSGQVSKFHRLQSDEVWFFHFGSPLRIHMIDAQGGLTTAKLGLALGEGERPQVVVPANTVFGADVVDKDSFALVSCMVSPGFDPRDFQLYSSADLISRYPDHHEIIGKLNG